MSVRLSVYLSVCLSVCLSVSISHKQDVRTFPKCILSCSVFFSGKIAIRYVLPFLWMALCLQLRIQRPIKFIGNVKRAHAQCLTSERHRGSKSGVYDRLAMRYCSCWLLTGWSSNCVQISQHSLLPLHVSPRSSVSPGRLQFYYTHVVLPVILTHVLSI